MIDDVSRRKFLELLGLGAFASALETSQKTIDFSKALLPSVTGSLVTKTSVQIDLVRLQNEMFSLIKSVGWHSENNQIGFTHREGCADDDRYWDSTGAIYDYEKNCFIAHEKDFAVFNSEHTGTYLHEVVASLPFKAARVRLMRLGPKKCFSMRDDGGPRYHLAIKTNPDAYVFYQDSESVFKIPEDGVLYRLDATKNYTEFNSNRSEERIHLVITDSHES